VTEAGTPTAERPRSAERTPRRQVPLWVLALVPLAMIAGALGTFVALDGPGLGERRGPPVEELAVEQTVLRPNVIELTVRNAGPDPVEVAQVFVNDTYVDFAVDAPVIDRLGSRALSLNYPWKEGQPYLVTMLTSTGVTIEHEIEAAVETPQPSAGFYGLMAALGTYVGVIPVILGMLFLPFLRRVRASWLRVFLAVTIGLLGFLAVDGTFEGLELAGTGSGVFGGPALVIIGAAVGYLALVAANTYLSSRRAAARAGGASGFQLSLMVAVGIGLHNMGEGLAIGSAYAAGALALGAFLVIGFALHNTTEGLAIVAPVSNESPSLGRLLGLGLIAGAPAILGAVVGASAYNPEVAGFLLGVGVGAIVQVIQQLVPTIRDQAGRALHPASVGGILAGGALLYVTGLLVAV